MKTIVVGCGRIGAELAMRLNAAGYLVSVVDPDRDAFERLGPGFRGRMIDGIGFDRATLIRAGVEQADALAAVTSDDASNVIIAHVARTRFNVRRVVARQYEDRHAKLYQVLDVQTASTVSWGVDRIEEMLCAPDLVGILSVGHGGVEIVNLPVSPMLVGQPLSQVQARDGLVVIAISRQGVTALPDPKMLLSVGDVLHLSIRRGTWGNLRKTLRLTEEKNT